MNILRRLASTSVVSKPAIPTASKINAVFTSLRNVFKSRSHQSFELETWKAYLDLEGADKAQSPPGLYSRMLVFVAANNMHSHKHKLLAFQLLDKDINISKNYAPNLMTAKPWNWDFVSLQAKLYQFAFDNDGVKKSIEQVQKYLLRAQIITPEHLQDALAAMIYVRYHLNGIEDAANWMEELLEIEWQTQNGPIKIPWETRVCKIVYKKLYNAGLSYEKFLGRCNSFGIPLDDSVVKVRMLLRDGDVESAIKIAEISAPKNSISDTVNELIGYHILSRHSSVKDLNLKNPKR